MSTTLSFGSTPDFAERRLQIFLIVLFHILQSGRLLNNRHNIVEHMYFKEHILLLHLRIGNLGIEEPAFEPFLLIQSLPTVWCRSNSCFWIEEA